MHTLTHTHTHTNTSTYRKRNERTQTESTNTTYDQNIVKKHSFNKAFQELATFMSITIFLLDYFYRVLFNLFFFKFKAVF